MINKGKALGIDYGDRRIGIAVSDNTREVIFPREYISNTGKEEVIQKIKELCEQEEIVLIVIGLPLNMEGEDTEQTRKVREFAALLKEYVETKIALQDERFTTTQSNAILTDIGLKTPEKREHKDSISAVLILQNYLDI